jgi:hypothetical protein
VGRRPCPRWLTAEEVLGIFGSQAKRGYTEFVVDGMKNGVQTPWQAVKGQAVIGSERFVDQVAKRHLRGRRGKRGEESRLREVVAIRPKVVIREVERYFGIKGEEIRRREQRYTEPRYLVSYLLRRYCLLSLSEIGARVGLHYSAVGNAIRQVRERPTRTQANSLGELEAEFKNQ